MLDVPGGMFGGEILALVPLGVLLDVKVQVLRSSSPPISREMRTGHVVDAGAGKIAADLAHDIRVIDPGKSMRVLDLGDALGDLEDAALGHFLRHGRRCEGLDR